MHDLEPQPALRRTANSLQVRLTAGPPPILYTVVGNSRAKRLSSTAVYPPCPRTAPGNFARSVARARRIHCFYVGPIPFMRLFRHNQARAGFYHYPGSVVGALLVGVSLAGLLHSCQDGFGGKDIFLGAFVFLGVLLIVLEQRHYRR